MNRIEGPFFYDLEYCRAGDLESGRRIVTRVKADRKVSEASANGDDIRDKTTRQFKGQWFKCHANGHEATVPIVQGQPRRVVMDGPWNRIAKNGRLLERLFK